MIINISKKKKAAAAAAKKEREREYQIIRNKIYPQ